MACLPEGRSNLDTVEKKNYQAYAGQWAEEGLVVGISSLPFLSLLLSNLLRGLYQELTKAISKRPARQTVRNNCPGGKACSLRTGLLYNHSVPSAASPASSYGEGRAVLAPSRRP